MVKTHTYSGRLLPEQANLVENHTFRTKTPYKNDATGLHLRQDDQGIITRLRSTGTDVMATFFSRTGSPEFSVPLKHLEVGPKSGTWTILHDEAVVTHIDRAAPRAGQLGANDIRTHLEGLLTGISEHQSQLGTLTSKELALINTPAAVRASADGIRGAFATGAPKLLALMNNKPNADIHAVIQACEKVSRGNSKAGIYMRVYSGFPPGSVWHGKIVIYIGQSNGLGRRNAEHDKDMWDKKYEAYNSVHYITARQAGKCDVLQLCVHNSNEGGSEEAGKTRRDLMEQVCFLLFGSYSSKVLKWAEDVPQRKTVQEAILKSYTERELSSVYTKIAAVAFAKTGWKVCSQRSNFGVADGLNWSSPFGGETYTTHEKILWAREELSDRYIFHRAAQVMDRQGTVMHFVTYRVKDATKYTPSIKVPKNDARFPQNGEKFWVTVEVMKPGHGIHDVPWARMPDLSPWDNWDNANKIAIKIIWQRNGVWMSAYVQSTQPRSFVDRDHPAANERYVVGVAMYAYFMRAAWPNPPEFYITMGLADMVDIKFDNFSQEVKVSVVVGPMVQLTEPTLDEDRVADEMEDLGLEHVNGNWQGFDWSWLYTNPHTSTNGKITSFAVGGMKQRKTCDYCWFLKASGHGNQKSGVQCDRKSEKRCLTCVVAGLPCSWSSFPALMGDDYLPERKMEGPRYEQIVKAFFQQPERTEACTPTQIQDPGLKVLASQTKG